jgi:hypothetical protein
MSAPISRLGEFALVCFELAFKIGVWPARLTDGRSRLRSSQTTFATVRSAFRAFARRGHLNRPHVEDQAFRG